MRVLEIWCYRVNGEDDLVKEAAKIVRASSGSAPASAAA